jgi:DNA-binding PadR family transcriptional regulator
MMWRGAAVAKRRPVNNLLALAVLTLAIERPMHPYEMATLLRERGKHLAIDIKWGSLYTVVQNLERHGLLEATGTTRRGRRPERTVYAITDAGRAELHEWMTELVAVPEKEFRRFEAALSEFGVLSPDEGRDLLARRVSALEREIAEQEALLELSLAQVPRLFLIENEYYLAMCRAEAEWVRGLLAEIDGGTLPGLAMWRAFHTPGADPAAIAGEMGTGVTPRAEP